MYDIGIDEIIVSTRLESIDGRSIKYQASAATRPSQCKNPSCMKELKPHKHSKYTCLIQDIKAEGKLVYIELTVQRYKCPECDCVFSDEFTFFEKNSSITNRLKKDFVDRCIRRETFQHIATEYSVDPKTVASAFNSYTKAHRELFTYDYTPVVLGIDEAHIDNHYRLILTDIKEQRLLDMKKDNKKKTVKAYLNTLDKSICKCATMDFAPGYAAAVREVLPDALVVIDKFHAVQEVNTCLDKVRIFLQNTYRSQGIDTKRFKRSKRLFMTNWEDLNESGIDKLNSWFNEFGELYDAYMTKEMFRDIYLVANTYDEAEKLFDAWLKFIPAYDQFGAMRKTMTSRRQDILNYWKAPYTNAYTESVNNIIKSIEKNGRGYKFDVLRERCMLALNTPKQGRFQPRKAVYINKTAAGQISKKRAAGLYLAIPASCQKGNSSITFPEISKFDYLVQTGNGTSIIVECMNTFMDVFNSNSKTKTREARIAEYYKRISSLLRSQETSQG